MTSRTTSLFRFEVGGFFSDKTAVTWDGANLVHRLTKAGSFQPVETRTTPTADQWADFWSTFAALGAWDWKPEYVTDVCDGDQWDLEVNLDGRTLRSGGSNGYPDRFGQMVGPEDQGAITDLRRALDKLCGVSSLSRAP